MVFYAVKGGRVRVRVGTDKEAVVQLSRSAGFPVCFPVGPLALIAAVQREVGGAVVCWFTANAADSGGLRAGW